MTVSVLLDRVSPRILKRSPSKLKCWIEGVTRILKGTVNIISKGLQEKSGMSDSK